MLDRTSISPRTARPPLRPTRPSSLATFPKNALLCFQSVAHSSQFTVARIPNNFYALRTLCQKHPGVGVATPFPIPDFPFPVVTSIESKRSTNNACNHLRIKTFHDTPGGWGPRTSASTPIRHFTRQRAKLVLPARSLLGGVR